ncbi:OmpA family protein [Hymenobacter sp. GOD-10R]|uniref:OmpA family protein n=1 Tax=Hymenobacter sp. GOD-10R TaxID=3093922 RepID=UPI002D788A71|nr:OmpA family protein [Hymenobacter sp. GOD-10R]WRQ29656.1 OmpA family protein [Hymenobacter sp. GOD-10R]
MRNVLAKSAALGLALLAAAPDGHAQTSDQKTAINIYGSTLQYHGDLGSEWFKHDKIEKGFGIGVDRYVAKGLDVGLNLSYGDMKFNANPPKNALYVLEGKTVRGFDANVVNVGIPIKLKLNNGTWALKEDAFFAPYLIVQPGVFFASTDRRFTDQTQRNSNVDIYAFDIMGAAGIKLQFSPAFSIFVQTGQHYPLSDRVDGVALKGNINDRYLQHTAGITVGLGKPKDTDGDGVPDRKDKCPDTPAGVAVDPNGCPLDGDGDGVPDYQDKCPTEKGLATLEGCPDRDGDGVRDGDDACPDQAGLPALKGCPDSDGDGVRDSDDKCPGTPAGTQVDATGCPVVTDADGDGVPDDRDKCPGTAPGSTVDSTGCRVIDPALMEKVKPVQFETNSTVLRKSSYPTLDNVITILNQYPEYSVRISGHADSRGTDEYNQGLSERRAASAKRYFTTKKMDPNRITTEGFGESQPAAPNTSKAGQAKNRRVEFKFEFYIPSAPQP